MSTTGQGAKRERPPLPLRPDLRERDEHLESLKVLAGQLVHDFNNFLAPIFGYLTLIREERPGVAVVNYADMMEKSTRRVEATLDTALLALRPQRHFRPERTDFTALIETVLAEWEQGLPGTARISVQKNLVPCSIDIDPAQWRHVILHLLNNVRYALVTGGHAEMSLQPATLTTAEAEALGMATTEVFKLTLRDRGFGMAPATLKRAFEPYFTTRGKSHALGVGLTIAHSVARLHGGQIALESVEDVGTTVTVWLSAAPATHRAPAAAGSPAAPEFAPDLRAPGTKILLVDDDPMVREVIKACLQREKYDVYVAPDGFEGLKQFERHARNLSLIISDVTMPNMNGIEMTERIRALGSNIPVILITGDTEFNLQEGILRLGDHAPEILKKPFAVKGLMELIRKCLN